MVAARGGPGTNKLFHGKRKVLGGEYDEGGGRRGSKRQGGFNLEDGFLEGLQVALEARLRKRLTPLTGGTGGSEQEDGSEHDILQESQLREAATHSNKDIDGMSLSEVIKMSTSKSDDKENEKRFIVNPRNKYKIAFDLLIGIITFFTILVLPWRIGFEQEATGNELIVDYIMDVFFAIDMCVCFRTGYYTDQDIYVYDPWKIARRYCCGLFVFDFFFGFFSDLPSAGLSDCSFSSSLSSTRGSIFGAAASSN